MSWEDELRLKLKIPVGRGDDAESVKAAVIAAIEKKLQEVPTDVFNHLDPDDDNCIVFRTVRPVGPGPDPGP